MTSPLSAAGVARLVVDEHDTKHMHKYKPKPNTTTSQPLSVHRRTSLIEKLAAFYYCWSFTLGLNIWMLTLLLCYYLPAIIPFVIIYTLYITIGPGVKPRYDGSWQPRWRNWRLWVHVRNYFNARLHKTVDLPPDKTYLFGYHPHGTVAFGAFLTFGTHAMGFQNAFPGIDVRVLTLNINFTAPYLREYLLFHGTCSVDKSACLNMLNNKKSICIVIGGGKESLYAKPNSADLVLNKRKGFVKIALQTGASLVPVYCYGENDTFSTVTQLPEHSFPRRFQHALLKKTGFTLPFVYGSFGLLPYPVNLDVVIGAPIEVPKFQGDVHSTEFHILVDKYHALYVQALTKLYEDNAEKYAKNGVQLRFVA